MPYPHIFRLRGPWQYTPLARFDFGPLPPPGRVELPTDWGATLGNEFQGRVRYERSFNAPSNLDPHERVWLVIDGADARADVSLNGQSLGTVAGYALSSEWDITEKIGPRNTLSIEVELPGAESQVQGTFTNSALRAPHSALDRPGREALPGGPIGQVRLEIRSSAFMAVFALWFAAEPNGPTLHCSGMVGGDGGVGPLSLVVGALEREVLYENVVLGQRFEYTAEAGEMPVWTPGRPGRLALVETKLISGGEAVWQRQFETAAIEMMEHERPDEILAAMQLPRVRAEFVSGDLESQVQKLSDQLAGGERAVAMPQILPEPLYAEFDRAGIEVLQAMPLGWAEIVCLRLAHHPAIQAWTLPPNESREQSAVPLPTCGRPWISVG